MKRFIPTIQIIILAALLWGCETEITLDGNSREGTQIVLNALAATDTTLTVAATRTEALTANSAVIDYKFYYAQWITNTNGRPLNELLSTWFGFPDRIILKDTELTYSINGNDDILMAYDEDSGFFVSDYRPSPGDKIRLKARRGGSIDVTAYATVPEIPEIQLLSYEKSYSKVQFGVVQGDPYTIDSGGCDTIVNMVVKIVDKPNEKNFYRLRIVNSATDPILKGISTDVFESVDPVFLDNQIASSFGLWPVHFSNVFDDHLFDGEEYVISLSSRLRHGTNKKLKVELEALTEDYFYYLKSVMRYLTTNNNGYSEPIRIHGNTSADFGILGAMSSKKISIDL